MATENFKPTKKVYEIKDDSCTLKEVTTEPSPKDRFNKKEITDLIFKIIGVAAIATPLFLTFWQRKAEIAKQRSLYEFELITTTTGELHSLLAKSPTDSGYQRSYSKIFYELMPKMSLLNDPRCT